MLALTLIRWFSINRPWNTGFSADSLLLYSHGPLGLFRYLPCILACTTRDGIARNSRDSVRLR